MPYLFRALRGIVPYLSRAVRTLVPHLPRSLRVPRCSIVPHLPRVLRVLMPDMRRVVRTLVHHVPLDLSAFVLHVSRDSRASCTTWYRTSGADALSALVPLVDPLLRVCHA